MSDRDLSGRLILAVVIVLSAGVVAAATADVTVPVSQNDDGIVLNEPGGPAITMTGNTKLINSSGSVNTTAVVWNTTDGNATFQSNGDTAATVPVSDFNATWTNLTAIDTSSADLVVSVDGPKPTVRVGGAVDQLAYQRAGGIAVDDASGDFAYAASGSGTVTMHNLPASTSYQAVTETGQDLGSYTSDSSGTATINLKSTTGLETVYLMTNDSPQIDDIDPNDGTGLTTKGVELNATVSDPDMNEPYGDELTVEFLHKSPSDSSFSTVATKTTASNGTVKTSLSGLEGGTHEFKVKVSDSYGGGPVTSSTNSFNVPDQLFIRNESQPSDIINNSTSTVRVYAPSGTETQIVKRNTSDGTLNLTGLPADQPLVVSVEAPGYRSRRIFVASLFDTQSVYLLPDNKTFTTVKFSITDYSGEFPQDTTVLEVQRAINGSYKTVVGDYFGATGEFSVIVRYNTRHRLVLRNTETGQTRVIGAYTPLSSGEESVTVSPSGDIQPPKRPPELSLQPSARNLVPQKSVPLTVTVRNRSYEFQSWAVNAYLINTTANTNTTLFSTSNTSADGGTVKRSVNLSQASGEIVKIVTTWERKDGETGNATAKYSVRAPFDNGDSLLSSLDSLTNQVPSSNVDAFTMMLSVALTVLGTAAVGSKIRLSSEILGGVAVLFLSVFGLFGWVPYSMLFVALVAWAALTMLRRGY